MKKRFNLGDRFGGNRFTRDEEPNMEKRLNEILADIMVKMAKYMNLDTSCLDELKAEEAEWIVKKDGPNLYIGKRTVGGTKQLSILESHIYQARIEALKYGANRDIFLEKEPERATEYLAVCVEQIRQIVGNHRFTREQFKVLYRPLERLARQLTVFEPEFTEEEREVMREDGVSEEEMDSMLKGAQQCHKYHCQMFEVYQRLAERILDGKDINQ